MSEAQAATGGSRYCIPEADSSERRIAIFIFLLGCCYLWLFHRFTMMDPDEGIILQGAQRILNGQVLYRDFFSFLTPGSFYQTALILRIFGDSIVTARSVLVVIGAIVSSITYLIARRACSRLVAISIAILVIVATLPYRFVVLHNWDSTLWASLATYLGLRWFETGGARWAFWTGTTTAVTFLFEQSKGAGVLLGVGICLIAVWLFQRDGRIASVPAIVAFLLGIAIPIAATFAFFASQQAVGPMLADLAWPFRHYSGANRVFYGYQNWNDSTRKMLFGSGSLLVRFITLWAVSPCFLVPALPLIGVGLLFVWLAKLGLRKAPTQVAVYYVFLNSVILGLLVSIIAVRADIVHFMYVFPILVLPIAWFLQGTDVSFPLLKPIKPLLVNLTAIAFLLFSASVLWRVIEPPGRIETRRGTITTPGSDNVIGYVQSEIGPGEKLLVYPYLPLYNYLTKTISPAGYDYFQPGMSTPEQASDIIQSLRSNPEAPVLYEYGFAGKIPSSWPATPISAIANDRIADFVVTAYRPCQLLRSANGARFLLLRSRTTSCASARTR